MGQGCRREGRFDEALEAAMDGLSVAQRTGNVSEELAFLGDLSLLSLRKGEHTVALSEAKRGFDLAQLSGKPELRLAFIGQMVQAFRELGRMDEARSHCKEGLRLALETKNLREAGAFYQDIALLEEREGNLKGAVEAFEASLHVMDKLGLREAVVVAHRNLALLEGRRGQGPKAFDHLTCALGIARSMDQAVFNQNFSSLFDLVAVFWREKKFDIILQGLELVNDLLRLQIAEAKGTSLSFFELLRKATSVLGLLAETRGDEDHEVVQRLFLEARDVDNALGTQLCDFAKKGFELLSET